MKNNELDLEKIINEYTTYTYTIINNMAEDNLNSKDKEEIVSEVFFILWKNKNNVLQQYHINLELILDYYKYY